MDTEREDIIEKGPFQLYAAGIDTGGWMGDTYCVRLSGTTFAFAINSGRIAGVNAIDSNLGER